MYGIYYLTKGVYNTILRDYMFGGSNPQYTPKRTKKKYYHKYLKHLKRR